MRVPVTILMMAVIAFSMLGCAGGSSSGRAFSRDWAYDQRRSRAAQEVRNRELRVLGQEIDTPDWLDRDERGRPELRVGENENSTTAISVDRGELGLRHRRGGGRNNLPPPPGFDARGNRISE